MIITMNLHNIYIHVHIHIHIHIHIYISCVYICIITYTYSCLYVYLMCIQHIIIITQYNIYIHIHIHIYISCVYICIYICIYIYIYIHIYFYYIRIWKSKVPFVSLFGHPVLLSPIHITYTHMCKLTTLRTLQRSTQLRLRIPCSSSELPF